MPSSASYPGAPLFYRDQWQLINAKRAKVRLPASFEKCHYPVAGTIHFSYNRSALFFSSTTFTAKLFCDHSIHLLPLLNFKMKEIPVIDILHSRQSRKNKNNNGVGKLAQTNLLHMLVYLLIIKNARCLYLVFVLFCIVSLFGEGG